MIPLGVADARVSGWPVVSLGVAAASLVLTALVWLAPDAAVGQAQQQVQAYAEAHTDEMIPEGCLPHLTRVADTDHIRIAASAEFERRCNKATEVIQTGHHMRFALQPAGHPTPQLAWLLHPFAWTNPLGAIAGLLLLVLVVGSFVEDHFGRARFAAGLAVATAVSALVWRSAAGEASDGWSGGQGYLAALLAVFVVTFTTRPVKFLILTPLPKQAEAPAWAVAVWWLLARAISLWLGDVDRPLVLAELVSFLVGAVAAGVLRYRGLAMPSPAAVAAAVPPPAAVALDPFDRRATVPAARASQQSVAAPVADPAADLPPVDQATAAAPDAAWAVVGPDPLAEPQIALRKRGATQSAKSETGIVAFAPSSAPGTPLASPAAEAAPAPAAAAPLVFDFTAPAAIEFAGQGTGFASPLAAVPALATPAPPAHAPDASDLLQPPGAFDLDALLAALPPPPTVERDTDIVAPPVAARAPEAPPPLAAQASPYDESTVAYAPGRAMPQLQPDVAHTDPTVPQVRLAERIDRAADGVLLALINEEWLRLDPAQVRAVAVGLILHSNHPGATAESWIDVVSDTGSRERAAHAVRLHPAREDLVRLLPDVPPSLAFARLAESLAAGGAFQLPQQPVWPGPPFPRYDTAAEFIRMWHRQLHG